MNSIAVLQARTNSSRLPGKVLLPIKGIPVAVLAARRAGNTGRPVVIATSEEHGDDALAALVQSHGLTSFRGSLENALSRVVDALSAYDGETLVFRLTADNVFPDGALLDEIEKEFLERGLDYLCCNGDPSGLPYGVSAEITWLAHLREAAREAATAHDQEHVTPYIIRKFGAAFFQKYVNLKKGHFRCTIDCLDDYIVMQQVFADVSDPAGEPFLALVERLEHAAYQPIDSAPASKLVFGCAQLGSSYGIANRTGQPDQKQCQELIKTAIANGVRYLDTARAYGSSEVMLGRALNNGWQGRAKIITKLSPLDDCPQNAGADSLRAFVDASVFRSCALLGVQKIDIMMLHRASHLFDWNGSIWQRLLELQSADSIGELGASVQTPDELSMVLDVPEIRYIQIPCHVLDWRWDAGISGILAAKASRTLHVHVRSTLLQGLLPSADDRHWQRANVEDAADVRDWLLQQVAACRRSGIADLCIGYMRALAWVDGIVLGMENMEQLVENIHLFNHPPLSAAQLEAIQHTRPRLHEATLNPAFWRKKSA